MLKYNEYFDIKRIDENKVSDISKNVLNKSRDLVSKAWKIGKRESRRTAMALDIIGQKMLKNRPITDQEKKFLKMQGTNLIKLLPLVVISGIPAPVPITPLLIALGRKYNFDILPKDHTEPEDFKNKKYLYIDHGKEV